MKYKVRFDKEGDKIRMTFLDDNLDFSQEDLDLVDVDKLIKEINEQIK